MEENKFRRKFQKFFFFGTDDNAFRNDRFFSTKIETLFWGVLLHPVSKHCLFIVIGSFTKSLKMFTLSVELFTRLGTSLLL
jgi:hypothetical protein